MTFSSFINNKKIIIFGDKLFPKVHGIKYCNNKIDLAKAINNHLKSRKINKYDIKNFVNQLNKEIFYNEFNPFQKKKKIDYKRISELYKRNLA